ncbi:chemotaxis protein CheD [Geomesophilobacter sediminis]|uniref:Probable chemoreceptor glutamine deamidase CheD n=1 Tax=Geomesophilobacter sediminis TaxID=2798584 RepID=A0A8J7JGJ4_9BACT|nr:chemotaxis protein CheD [Geomesophilobacter sediminis]MBJ6725919.1 chemotaxis protein CheD [Geomesophilobacter sediminis]
MRIETKGRFQHVTLEPGEFYASPRPVTISTLLGSCVSACLYDPVEKIVGMNHFLLSNRRYARNLPTIASEAGRYGVHAMELLINEMLHLGARRKRLMAKVFGGATILKQTGNIGNFFCVGEVNCRFIEEFLAEERIPIVAKELGGEKGRVIHFSNGDFTVYVRKVERGSSERLALRDRNCWLKSIEVQELALPSQELWLDEGEYG